MVSGWFQHITLTMHVSIIIRSAPAQLLRHRPWRLGASWAQPSAFTASPFCSLASSSLASHFLAQTRAHDDEVDVITGRARASCSPATGQTRAAAQQSVLVGRRPLPGQLGCKPRSLSPGALKEKEGSRQGNCTAGPWPEGEEPGSLHHVCLLCCVLEFERQLPTASAEIPP